MNGAGVSLWYEKVLYAVARLIRWKLVVSQDVASWQTYSGPRCCLISSNHIRWSVPV